MKNKLQNLRRFLIIEKSTENILIEKNFNNIMEEI